jgi:hypothetical protein
MPDTRLAMSTVRRRHAIFIVVRLPACAKGGGFVTGIARTSFAVHPPICPLLAGRRRRATSAAEPKRGIVRARRWRSVRARQPGLFFKARLLVSIYKAITQTVPGDPDHPDFRLGKRLGAEYTNWRRVKKGMPGRYRLFFRFASALATSIEPLLITHRDALRGDSSRRLAKFGCLLLREIFRACLASCSASRLHASQIASE